MINLTQKEFIGHVVPKEVEEFYDYKLQGSYKIHIPELMPHLNNDDGIWCKNHTNKWNITPSDIGEYGSHFPLHPGTYVVVKFFDNDINAGYIDRILSDYKVNRDVEAQDCVSAKTALEDRDEQYVIFKTPKKWSTFYVNENTQNEPNTIYLIYNRDNNPQRRTVYRIDESGIHIWTRDNMRVRIAGDENKQIDGDQTSYVKGSTKHNIDGDYDYQLIGSAASKIDGNSDQSIGGNHTSQVLGNRDEKISGKSVSNVGSNYDGKVGGSVTIDVSGPVSISADGPVSVWSGSSINATSSSINLNSAAAQKTSPSSPKTPKTPKPKTEVKDLGPNETPEYQTGVGNGCDDVTNSYNVGKRDNDKMIE